MLVPVDFVLSGLFNNFENTHTRVFQVPKYRAWHRGTGKASLGAHHCDSARVTVALYWCSRTTESQQEPTRSRRAHHALEPSDNTFPHAAKLIDNPLPSRSGGEAGRGTMGDDVSEIEDEIDEVDKSLGTLRKYIESMANGSKTQEEVQKKLQEYERKLSSMSVELKNSSVDKKHEFTSKTVGKHTGTAVGLCTE